MQAAQPANTYRRSFMKYKMIRISHGEIVCPILGRHFITKRNTTNKYSTKHLLLRNDLCCLHDSFIISNLCYDKVFTTTIISPWFGARSRGDSNADSVKTLTGIYLLLKLSSRGEIVCPKWLEILLQKGTLTRNAWPKWNTKYLGPQNDLCNLLFLTALWDPILELIISPCHGTSCLKLWPASLGN